MRISNSSLLKILWFIMNKIARSLNIVIGEEINDYG